MKEIKLRRINSIKYCTKCKKNVKIIMDRLNGRCPDCMEIVYTLDSRQRN